LHRFLGHPQKADLQLPRPQPFTNAQKTRALFDTADFQVSTTFDVFIRNTFIFNAFGAANYLFENLQFVVRYKYQTSTKAEKT
jgi:hypothetical protein